MKLRKLFLAEPSLVMRLFEALASCTLHVSFPGYNTTARDYAETSAVDEPHPRPREESLFVNST